jgi:RNA-directed DNA polymerase
VPKNKKRRLRQELHYAKKFGLRDHLKRIGIISSHEIQQNINRLDGLVKFTAYLEPELSAPLKSTWRAILQSNGASPSFEPKNQEGVPFYIYVDEAEYKRPTGERMLALAMAVSQRQEQIDQITQTVLDAALSDVWGDGDRSKIKRKGLHFTDITEDLRLAYVERMQFLPFEGYVAMATLANDAAYEDAYLRGLKTMIKRRLMAAESRYACFVFEENNKVSQEAVKKVVMQAHRALVKANNRHPKKCVVKFAKKPSLGMTVPDFLLGVLGRYLSSESDQGRKNISRNKLLFERIRDKYRLIVDIDGRVEYSRRRGIEPWQIAVKN